MAVHIAYIGFTVVDGVGSIVDKNDTTFNTLLTSSSELRVIYDATYAPNASGYPTIPAYLTLEDTDGFALVHMDNTIIITSDSPGVGGIALLDSDNVWLGSNTFTNDVSVVGLSQTGYVHASINVETLSATKTLITTDPQVHLLDGGVADRTVELPDSPATGLTYTIKNTGSTNDLNVEDGGSSVIDIGPGLVKTVIYSGTEWVTL